MFKRNTAFPGKRILRFMPIIKSDCVGLTKKDLNEIYKIFKEELNGFREEFRKELREELNGFRAEINLTHRRMDLLERSKELRYIMPQRGGYPANVPIQPVVPLGCLDAGESGYTWSRRDLL
jgi:hypothetical protein